MYPIRPWLYVGKYRETLNRRLLHINGIGSMLQLAERVDQPGIASLYLPVDDGVPLPPGSLDLSQFVTATDGSWCWPPALGYNAGPHDIQTKKS